MNKAQDEALPPLPLLPQSLLDQISRYGLARTDNVLDTERIHMWQLLHQGIKEYAKNYACAALAAAAGQVEQREATAKQGIWEGAPATVTVDANALGNLLSLQTEPIGYLPAYELQRLMVGHGANLRSAKFGPGALDGDVPVYVLPPLATPPSQPQAAEPVMVGEELGSCCYGGLKRKADCASCAAWTPQPAQAEPKEGLAHLSFKLVSHSGYEQESEFHNITPEQFGEVVRVLHGGDIAQAEPVGELTDEVLEQAARGLVAWWDSPHEEHEAFIVANLQTWVERLRAALSAPVQQAAGVPEK